MNLHAYIKKSKAEDQLQGVYFNWFTVLWFAYLKLVSDEARLYEKYSIHIHTHTYICVCVCVLSIPG